MMILNRGFITFACFILSSCGSSLGALPAQHQHHIVSSTQTNNVQLSGFTAIADSFVLTREITGLETKGGPVEEPPKMTSEGFFRRKLCHLVGGHCCAAWRTRSTITELLSSSMRQTIT